MSEAIQANVTLPRNVVERVRARTGIHNNMGELLRAALIIAADATDDELVAMARNAAIVPRGRPPRNRT